MKSWIVAGVLGVALTGAPSVEADDSPKKRKLTEAERKDLEKKIISTMNAQGAGIDRCVGRYTGEYPRAKGQVELALHVDGAGKVVKATAKTSLAGARTFRPCLEEIGRMTRFPVPKNFVPTTLTFRIRVVKGAKFKLYAPGERPPKPESGKEDRPTRWNYQPGSFGFL